MEGLHLECAIESAPVRWLSSALSDMHGSDACRSGPILICKNVLIAPYDEIGMFPEASKDMDMQFSSVDILLESNF